MTQKETQQTRITTNNGGAIRVTQPTGRSRQRRSKADIVVDVITPKAVDGFIGFLREHAVVGLAVGLVIGTQLKAIVDALNAGFISQLFGLFIGGSSLASRIAIVHWHGNSAKLAWGSVVYQVIDFIFVMAVLYAIIKVFNLDKLDQPKT